jgi:hypothetical protein
MSMSSTLFTAILAMDAYNRGHGARVFGLSDENGTRIGTATILTSDNVNTGEKLHRRPE